VGGNLRPHHTGAQHRHLANDQSAHMLLLLARPGSGPLLLGTNRAMRKIEQLFKS
jgi:hypothetical protein